MLETEQIKRKQDGNALVNWWYRISTPRNLSTSTPKEREYLRRARFTSTIALILLVAAMLGLIATLTQNNPVIVFTSIFGIICHISTLIFNKKGWLNLSGITCMAGILVGILGPLAMQGKLSIGSLPIFYILSVTEIIVAAIFPPVMILICCGINSLITIVALYTFPKDSELQTLMAHEMAISMVVPIILYVILGFTLFFVVRNYLDTIARADRAEEIARLQQHIAQVEHERAAEKDTLQYGIEQLSKTMAEIANGNWDARVSLQGHVLWPVAGPLNTLLNRAQKWRLDSMELARIKKGSHEVNTSPLTETSPAKDRYNRW